MQRIQRFRSASNKQSIVRYLMKPYVAVALEEPLLHKIKAFSSVSKIADDLPLSFSDKYTSILFDSISSELSYDTTQLDMSSIVSLIVGLRYSKRSLDKDVLNQVYQNLSKKCLLSIEYHNKKKQAQEILESAYRQKELRLEPLEGLNILEEANSYLSMLQSNKDDVDSILFLRFFYHLSYLSLEYMPNHQQLSIFFDFIKKFFISNYPQIVDYINPEHMVSLFRVMEQTDYIDNELSEMVANNFSRKLHSFLIGDNQKAMRRILQKIYSQTDLDDLYTKIISAGLIDIKSYKSDRLSQVLKIFANICFYAERPVGESEKAFEQLMDGLNDIKDNIGYVLVILSMYVQFYQQYVLPQYRPRITAQFIEIYESVSPEAFYMSSAVFKSFICLNELRVPKGDTELKSRVKDICSKIVEEPEFSKSFFNLLMSFCLDQHEFTNSSLTAVVLATKMLTDDGTIYNNLKRLVDVQFKAVYGIIRSDKKHRLNTSAIQMMVRIIDTATSKTSVFNLQECLEIIRMFNTRDIKSRKLYLDLVRNLINLKKIANEPEEHKQYFSAFNETSQNSFVDPKNKDLINASLKELIKLEPALKLRIEQYLIK